MPVLPMTLTTRKRRTRSGGGGGHRSGRRGDGDNAAAAADDDDAGRRHDLCERRGVTPRAVDECGDAAGVDDAPLDVLLGVAKEERLERARGARPRVGDDALRDVRKLVDDRIIRVDGEPDALEDGERLGDVCKVGRHLEDAVGRVARELAHLREEPRHVELRRAAARLHVE